MISFQSTITGYAPTWLRRRIGGSFLESVGITLDCAMQSIVEGVRASHPFQCKPDALPHLGVERRIRQYPNEPDSSYRKRLAEWRQAWKLAGSHHGEMRQIQPYFLPAGLPRIRVVHQAGDGSRATWHTLEPDGTYLIHRATPSNFDWDGVVSKWSRFWIIIYLDGLGLPDQIAYDEDYRFDEGWLWDGGLTIDQCDDIVSIANDWKAAHSILWGVILARDPLSFDPTSIAITNLDGTTTLPIGNWGWITDPFTGLPTRLDTASYPFDLGHG